MCIGFGEVGYRKKKCLRYRAKNIKIGKVLGTNFSYTGGEIVHVRMWNVWNQDNVLKQQVLQIENKKKLHL